MDILGYIFWFALGWTLRALIHYADPKLRNVGDEK